MVRVWPWVELQEKGGQEWDADSPGGLEQAATGMWVIVKLSQERRSLEAQGAKGDRWAGPRAQETGTKQGSWVAILIVSRSSLRVLCGHPLPST